MKGRRQHPTLALCLRATQAERDQEREEKEIAMREAGAFENALHVALARGKS